MMRRISVIGTGYLGATHAAAMAELGWEVIGLDTDERKIERLRSGTVPFYEPGLDELLQRNLANGRLRFTTSYEEVAEFADAHFVCVGTPQKARARTADLSYVDASYSTLARFLTRPATVIGKSTVPVGTAARLQKVLRDLAPAGDDVDLVWNPEFLREGFGVEDSLRPDRIVLGVADPADGGHALEVMRDIYSSMLERDTPLVVTDFATAELVKVAANSFLATKISFINAMAEVCEVAGGDVAMLAEAIGYDDRIGPKFLRAGIGFGGGCLPKDIRAFLARAGELGLSDSLAFLREVDEINLRRRKYTVDLARDLVGGRFVGKKIACLGAAFKPDSDDVRDSPALDVAAAIYTAGGDVEVHDPKALGNAHDAYPNLVYRDSLDDVLRGADIVLHLTEWREYRELDPAHAASLVRTPLILDGRNALDPALWRSGGWTFRALGRPGA